MNLMTNTTGLELDKAQAHSACQNKIEADLSGRGQDGEKSDPSILTSIDKTTGSPSFTSDAGATNDAKMDVEISPDDTKMDHINSQKEKVNPFNDALRKAGVAVAGGAMIGVGIVMIPLPTPFGAAVAASGLCVLSSEFEAAKTAKNKIFTSIEEAKNTIVTRLESIEVNDSEDECQTGASTRSSCGSSESLESNESDRSNNHVTNGTEKRSMAMSLKPQQDSHPCVCTQPQLEKSKKKQPGLPSLSSSFHVTKSAAGPIYVDTIAPSLTEITTNTSPTSDCSSLSPTSDCSSLSPTSISRTPSTISFDSQQTSPSSAQSLCITSTITLAPPMNPKERLRQEELLRRQQDQDDWDRTTQELIQNFDLATQDLIQNVEETQQYMTKHSNKFLKSTVLPWIKSIQFPAPTEKEEKLKAS